MLELENGVGEAVVESVLLAHWRSLALQGRHRSACHVDPAAKAVLGFKLLILMLIQDNSLDPSNQHYIERGVEKIYNHQHQCYADFVISYTCKIWLHTAQSSPFCPKAAQGKKGRKTPQSRR